MTTPAEALAARIGHRFAEPRLLDEALTHSSAADGRPRLPINERLEFLGDRVLGLIIAERLYRDHPELGESGLAPRLNALVNRQACARAARRIGLGEALVVSKSEEQGGGRDKDTILGDACEALIAAIYLDAGLEAAAAFVERAWAEEFAQIAAVAPREPKTALQEWAAQTRRAPPKYSIVERTGPDHAPAFIVEVEIPGLPRARGAAGSKREAERAAAAALLAELGLHG